MKPLNFEHMNYTQADMAIAQCIDDMTFASMIYNVEDCNMQWEDLATIFGPDTAAAAQARYMMMKGAE